MSRVELRERREGVRVECDVDILEEAEGCPSGDLPDWSYGHYRFGAARRVTADERRAIEAALARGKNEALATPERFASLLELAALQRRLGNEFEAREAAIYALHLDPSTPERDRAACAEIVAWASQPRVCERYAGSTNRFADESLGLGERCPTVSHACDAIAHPDPAHESRCIDAQECERDELSDPMCTARVFAASFGEEPAKDTEGCFDLPRLFGARPPLHAEQLAELSYVASPFSGCDSATRNTAYLRSLESTTLAVTSSYVRMRMRLEACGSERLVWARRLRLFDLGPPGTPEHIDPTMDEETIATNHESYRGCP